MEQVLPAVAHVLYAPHRQQPHDLLALLQQLLVRHSIGHSVVGGSGLGHCFRHHFLEKLGFVSARHFLEVGGCLFDFLFVGVEGVVDEDSGNALCVLDQVGDSFEQDVVDVSEGVADDRLELVFSHFCALLLLALQQDGQDSGGVVVVRFVHFGFEVVEDVVALQLALQFF